MRDETIPNWLRVLGWGLLASVILHWIVLDLMRATERLPGPPSTALHAILRNTPHDGIGITKETGLPASSPAPRLAAARNAIPHAAREGTLSPVQSLSSPPSNSPAGVLHVEGLRSGQAAEALVGLRLALAQSLTASLSSKAMPSELMLWCDFDGSGHLIGIRGESAPLDAALQTSIRQAAAQLIVPEPLAGSPFSLDVLLEPDD